MPYSKSKEKLELTYKFICAFIKKYNYPPSVREICHTVGFKSTASAQYYLNMLESQGLIERSSCKNRTIKIVDNDDVNSDSSNSHVINTVSLPLVGNIAAGQPLLAGEINDEYYNVPSDYFNITGNCFLLKVSGESMIEAGIFDGDMVLIHQQNTANPGQIIAAQIDNENVTLKRFYQEGSIVRLHPENSYMSDIIVTPDHKFRILGVIIGLMRNTLN